MLLKQLGLVCGTLVLLTRVVFAQGSSTDTQGQTAPPAPTTGQTQVDSPASTESSDEGRRAMPQPFDNAFSPMTDYIGPLIGVPDTTEDYPLTKAVWNIIPSFKDARIRVYGFVNPGMSLSSSTNSNIPLSYAIVPNTPELDQGILRIERVPDTYQTDHIDVGFQFTSLYGIDYRWTTAQGYFSSQLIQHNQLYGYDPVEAYGLVYFPKVAQGMVLQFGRYISPPDIEAQLAPNNYLFTHSEFFDWDAYTYTGVNAQIMLNKNWTILLGLHAGDDIALWAPAAHVPSFQAMARWVSPSNNDSLYGGVASINDGQFKANHANQQQFNLTWTHRFNPGFLDSAEMYYMYVWNSHEGGTCIFGPSMPFASGGGCGALLPGLSSVLGAVNFTEIKLSDKDFLSIRESWLNDVRGERSGFPTSYGEMTIGVTHHFSDLTEVRPELRYERAFAPGVTPWDNGTRKDQKTFNIDLIQYF